MKITRIETLAADAGYRVASYLKLSTDEGLVGWSEFYDGFAGVPLAPLIAGFGRAAVGMDPRAYARLSESLLATTRLASGGLAHQAIAAIENACLDVAAKSYGVPVHALFGGPFRDRVLVYWTHCGSYRVRHAAFYDSIGCAPIRGLDDFVAMGREAATAGFKVLKTNPVFFDGAEAAILQRRLSHRAGLSRPQHLRCTQSTPSSSRCRRCAQGAGDGMGLMLDLSFSQRTEGYLRIARAPWKRSACTGSSSTCAIPRRWR